MAFADERLRQREGRHLFADAFGSLEPIGMVHVPRGAHAPAFRSREPDREFDRMRRSAIPIWKPSPLRFAGCGLSLRPLPCRDGVGRGKSPVRIVGFGRFALDVRRDTESVEDGQDQRRESFGVHALGGVVSENGANALGD